MIKQLVMLPVAPLRLTAWVIDEVAQNADQRLNSPQARMQRLREIEEARERGELHEEHAAELEAQIIEEATAAAPVKSAPTAIEDEDGAQDDRGR
jgi:hypothetical protein